MAPTSEERLHVAAMLYDEAADFRNLCEKYDNEWTIDLGDVPAVFQDITHYLGFDGVVRVDELFERLAELIDPTCEMTDASWDNGERTWGCVCSACGAHIEHTRGCFLDYCPHCGARVVDDERRGDAV